MSNSAIDIALELFDSTKIIPHFGCTNIIFANCIAWKKYA